MAIARMSHIRLVGLKSRENNILDVLTQNGIFEARQSDDVSYELKRGDGADYRKLMIKQGKVAFALGFLKARHAAMRNILAANIREVNAGHAEPYEYALSDEKYAESRMLVTHADFSDARAKEYDLLNVCDTLEGISFEIVDTSSEVGSITSAIKEYETYSNSPLKLSVQNREGDVRIALFYSRSQCPVEQSLDALEVAYDVRRNDGVLVTAVCRRENFAEVEKVMLSLGFSRCAATDDMTAAERIDELNAELKSAKRKVFELTAKALGYEKYVKELKILYDVIGLEIERAQADEGFLKTDGAFVLEGWLPEACAEGAVARVREIAPETFVQLLAPEDRDEPPTLVTNNKVVSPYEDVTNLYSPPNYREADPNPIMSIFYFVFFGIMIGDAAYGVILAVLGLVLGCSKKFDRGAKRLLLLVGMGGISAVIWGIVFGGYFAIDFGSNKIALWFNPLEDPMTMLVMSLVLGAVQLVAAYVMLFIKLCRAGKPFSAVFDAGSIIILFGALGCLASTFLFKTAPKGLTIAAIVLAAIGLALIVIFGGRNSKNPFGKVLGGLKGVYGLVNLLSDLLSYCRLFGLGLASCAIGLAFNTLGTLIMGVGGFGYVLGVLLLIPLHAFNIAIGVLGAYVHDARLQFLEFYGKFYDGGGRLFSPLGEKTRYIRFE